MKLLPKLKASSDDNNYVLRNCSLYLFILTSKSTSPMLSSSSPRSLPPMWLHKCSAVTSSISNVSPPVDLKGDCKPRQSKIQLACDNMKIGNAEDLQTLRVLKKYLTSLPSQKCKIIGKFTPVDAVSRLKLTIQLFHFFFSKSISTAWLNNAISLK